PVDRLALPAAVAGTRQGERPEDARKQARGKVRQPAHLLSLGQGQAGPEVAGALPIQEGAAGGAAGAQEVLPKPLLERVKARALPRGLQDEGAQVVAAGVEA